METQMKAYLQTSHDFKFVTIFGYSSKGVPSLEINGVGKLSKNIREKLIYLTRTRKLRIPLRRFVICVDKNEIGQLSEEHLKHLEFPILLVYWYLAGILPIKKLENCFSSGWIKANGEIYQSIFQQNNVKEDEELKFIGHLDCFNYTTCTIESSLLLEHIPNLKFKID